jgi:hypothetical protein
MMIPVSSGNIRAVGYSTDESALYVDFVNGRRYRYRGVPQSVYRQLMAAGSKGRYFWRSIRDRYPYDRLA